MNVFKDFIISYLPLLGKIGILMLKAGVVLCVGWFVAFFIRKKVAKILIKKDAILANFTAQFAFVLCLIIVVITTLGIFGVPTTSILTILGTAGVAIALALRDSLSSIAGGIILIILRPFKKGDQVELNGLIGRVENVGLFNTSIRLLDEKLAILPNRNIVNANIINSSESERRCVEWTCNIDYQHSIEEIDCYIKDIVNKIQLIDKNIPPFLEITHIKSNTFNLKIRAWAKNESEVNNLYHLVVKEVKTALDSKNICISLLEDSTKKGK